MSKTYHQQPPLARRRFLWMASSAVAGLTWTASSYGRIIGSNDRIRVGFIGAGGMATNHMKAYLNLKVKNNLQAVAVADCWEKRAGVGAELTGSFVLRDYRQMLDRPDIDYVTIATPEHQHAQMTLDALDSGKAVYCEKPLTHTISETIAVLDKQKETQLPIQVGIQGMSDDSYVSAGQAIRDGVIGKVVHAQTEYVRRYGAQGLFVDPSVTDAMPKPEDLDWKSWLGTAPPVKWNPHHYFEWRCYSAYSGGIATDLLVHRLARIMKACDLLYPRRVVGMGGIWHWRDHRDLPDNFEMICEYPRGMTVYVLGTQSNRVANEHLIRGYRGTLYFTPEGWTAKDKDDKELAMYKKSGAEDVNLHHTNLHNHLRNGEELNCPAEFAAAAGAAAIMANESWRLGQMISWDDRTRNTVPSHSVAHNPYAEKAE